MNFNNAYKELLQGKKIRRKEWEHNMHLRLIGECIKTYKAENTLLYSDSTLLLSKGWRVVEGDGKELSFVEALEELKLKKWITKEGMDDSFIFIDNGQFTLCKPVEYDFMPTFKCLCSNDWEIMK